MSNFKSGSGDLDFGESDQDDGDTKSTDKTPESQEKKSESTDSRSAKQSPSSSSGTESTEIKGTSDRSVSNRTSTDDSATTSGAEQYPYFIRRNNVGDERDTRLEIHVRDKVADQEAEFRNEVADHLGTNEVSKTDAREFALLAAFHHPKKVAKLMADEGFGALE